MSELRYEYLPLRCIWLSSDHVTCQFHKESTLYICLNIKNFLLKTGAKSEVYVTAVFDCVLWLFHVRLSAWIYTLYFPECQELLAQSRGEIWSLPDWSESRTQHHLIEKRSLNHLDELAKCLSCVVSTYLHGSSNCLLLSCDIGSSEWIHSL